MQIGVAGVVKIIVVVGAAGAVEKSCVFLAAARTFHEFLPVVARLVKDPSFNSRRLSEGNS